VSLVEVVGLDEMYLISKGTVIENIRYGLMEYQQVAG
jgi:hypothetical protein